MNGRRTTLRLEADFIRALREIARREGLTPSGLVTRIDKRRDPATQGLTSSVRIYVVQYYRKLARQRRPENAAGRA